MPALMNGAEGLYLINSGMRGAALTANDDAYARAGVGAPILRRGDPGGFVDIERFELHDDLVVEKASAAWGYIAANATRDEFRFDGMIGLELLAGRTWTLDFAKRTLYFSEPKVTLTKAAATSPQPAKKSGEKPAKKPDAKAEKK